ncbi:MAG: ABC transporter ATP-binding protein [Bacilli bacterium]
MKIELKNLKKSFKDNIILDNINVTFESAKITGITGRNGSGKSVLFKIISQIYDSDLGYIFYDGVKIDDSNNHTLDIRVLIDKPCFLDDLSGYDNLKLLAEIQNKIGNDEIMYYVNELNLTNDINKKYYKYSLGMKQKLGIIQAFMENPKVIILDEPFNGLDKQTVLIVKKMLNDERKKGKLILLASHIESDIKDLCDIIYEIDNGKLVKIL